MVSQAMSTIKVFYCYAHEDDALREQLAKHLSPLRRLRYITGWYDRDIQAGIDWERESEAHLDTANIILLLISADFFASDYHYNVEMQQALAKHKAGTAHVLPILLRPARWKETPISELSALPTNEKPVTQWANQDEAWLNVVEGIREVIGKLLSEQELSGEEVGILYPEHGSLSGRTVGEKYLLGELIGEGGFSQVYKAQHLLLQRQQAVKVLLERHFRKQEFRDRFLREARTIATFDHPHIIHLDDFWVEASQAYLVMPYISGGTLQDILEKQQGFLERDQIVSYLEDICAALDYAHEREVVHLDLKPLNLLVREDGGLLLSDFGLAHLMKEGAIAGGSSLRVGTPHYMAPEHIEGSPERRSDLFSLGVMLYQMLLGRLPFEGLPQETIILKNMIAQPPKPRSLRPELPKAAEDVLEKALAKQAEQRYQTANELLVAFKNAFAPNSHMTRLQYSQKSNTPNALDAQYRLPCEDIRRAIPVKEFIFGYHVEGTHEEALSFNPPVVPSGKRLVLTYAITNNSPSEIPAWLGAHLKRDPYRDFNLDRYFNLDEALDVTLRPGTHIYQKFFTIEVDWPLGDYQLDADVYYGGPKNENKSCCLIYWRHPSPLKIIEKAYPIG